MPHFEYSRWDGTQQFQPLSADAAFDQISEYLLEHGEYILRQLDRLEPDNPDLLQHLIKAGYLERDEKGHFAVSPKGIRRIQERALSELFQIEKKDGIGKHDTNARGAGQVQHDESRPYQFGDPVANLNLHETLKNAVVRQGGGSPIRVSEEDFVVHETEYQTSCATVLLLDWYGTQHHQA